MLSKFFSSCGAVGVALACAANATAQVVFTSDFNTPVVPVEFTPNTAFITGVQGYAGLGPVGNQFGGSFLRSQTANRVTLRLTNLPPHSAVSIAFLFAAIDSLDGTGASPAGDFFHVTLDGVTIFNESFANATPDQIQSYVPPSGVQLARRVDLGFSGPGSYFTDSAYNLGADPVFSNLPHSASSLTLDFIIEGSGGQSLDDESWAMDNLSVTLSGAPVPPTLTIAPTTPGQATISWSPPTPGFVLQESSDLLPAGWTNSFTGATNPVVVPLTLPHHFFRLIKP